MYATENGNQNEMMLKQFNSVLQIWILEDNKVKNIQLYSP